MRLICLLLLVTPLLASNTTEKVETTTKRVAQRKSKAVQRLARQNPTLSPYEYLPPPGTAGISEGPVGNILTPPDSTLIEEGNNQFPIGIATTPGSLGTAQAEGSKHHHHGIHVQSIDVACSKTEMIIRILFDIKFNGVIYSKGHFADSRCRYVSANSGQKVFQFTVRLDECGTQFIDQFQGQGGQGPITGQAYLENIIVIQNEFGIQEIWDSSRRIRCLWQGNIKKVVESKIGVDMLDLTDLNFSGDDATTTMDVQVGRGPFAASATGLVKIGEIMTMVIAVDASPEFDVHVRECVAHPGDRSTSVQLTDTNGCVLKPKFVGAFQKTRQTGNTGASLLAYAFFQAFKFPDQMDVYLECNVELCKGQCSACQNRQSIEPETEHDHSDTDARPKFKREANVSISSIPTGSIKVSRRVQVISPDDVNLGGDSAAIALATGRIAADGICMSVASFTLTFLILLIILLASITLTAVLYLRSAHSKSAMTSNFS